MQILQASILVAVFYSVLFMKEPRKEARRTKEEHLAIYRILYYVLIPVSAVAVFILGCLLRTEIVIGLTLFTLIWDVVFLNVAYRKKA